MEFNPRESWCARKLTTRALQTQWMMLLLALAFWLGPGQPARAQLLADAAPPAPPTSIWENGVGEGFAAHVSELTLSAGPGFGMIALGGQNRHDWVIGALDYGLMLGHTVAQDHWWRGNWEFVGEVFGGAQYHPDSAYLVGLTPFIRYNLATGTRFVPFINIGAGVTATDIRNQDLSTTFEFNLQGGVGARYFVRDNLALTVQYRYIHISNANLDSPNRGVNNNTFLFGVSWFF